VLYSINQKLLTFCPEFLREHLLNYLITTKDVDYIRPQPINIEMKRIRKLLEKP
jgi:Tfp pilus assembly protein PilN